MCINQVKNVPECWLTRSASHKETVDVFKLNYVLRVCLGDWACIQNPRVLRNLFAAVLWEPASDQLHGFLRLICWAYFASVEGPDWFICDNDFLPLRLIEMLLDGVELTFDDSECLFCFSFFQCFTDAVDQSEVCSSCLLNFCTNNFLSLIIELSSFAMSYKYPLNLVVGKLLCANFSCKCTYRMGTDILSSNHNRIGKSCFGQIDVKHSRQNHKVELAGVILEVIEKVGNDVPDKGSRAITLPVGDYAILSYHLIWL